MSFAPLLRAALLPALLLAGCEPAPTPNPQPPPEPISFVVQGTLRTHYRTDTGEDVVPTPDPDLQAFAPGADGFKPLAVEVSPDGTFRIPEAPEGTYVLRSGATYLQTASRQVNLDAYALGRRDARTATELPPTVVSVSNLAPSARDTFSLSLQAVSANVGMYGGVLLEDRVPANTTSLTRAAADFTQFNPYPAVLLDASRGDELYVTAFREHDDGIRYESVDRFFRQSLRMDAASTTHIEGTFQELPEKTLTVNARSASFEAHASDMHPQATNPRFSLYISPTAGSTEAWYGSSGELAAAYGLRPPLPETLNLRYGNPYPTAWGEVFSLRFSVTVDLKLPGTTSGFVYGLGLGDIQPTAESATSPRALRISPPRELTVDGADGHQASTLGSLTPRIAWKAPQVGTPSAYMIRITRLDAEDTKTRRSHMADLYTQDTSFQLPPGLLQAGQTYVIQVTSLLTPGVDVTTHPNAYLTCVNLAEADTLSGQLTTPAALAPARPE